MAADQLFLHYPTGGLHQRPPELHIEYIVAGSRIARMERLHATQRPENINQLWGRGGTTIGNTRRTVYFVFP